MSKEEFTPHWRCRVCGAKSPKSAKFCWQCSKDLVLYGEYVSSEPTPPPPPPSPEEQKKNPGEQKKNPVVVLLIILLMGALIVFLPGRNGGSAPAPVQPPVQTNPVDTPVDTQPVQKTDPPAANLPAAELPATQPLPSGNSLKATIHGEEIILPLDCAYENDSRIYAEYRLYHPGDELRYYLCLDFEGNLGVGTYSTTGSILDSKANITFWDCAFGEDDYFYSCHKHGEDTDITGTFVIEKISDDRVTYDGSFNVELELYGKKDSIVIDDAVFNFTLQ